MKSLYAVYGASGFGREIMPLARASLSNNNGGYGLLFIDDALCGQVINGHDVISFDQFAEYEADNKYVCLAISNSKIREELFNKIKVNGISGWSIMADNAVFMDECKVGENTIIAPFVTITSNVRIGKSFHANIYSYVAHDCVIGDFVTFAPSVKCNGNVEIGDHAYIGTGVIIKQGKPGKPLIVGVGAVVAAGAVVTKNVPDGMTVFGNPAAPLTKENIKKSRRALKC